MKQAQDKQQKRVANALAIMPPLHTMPPKLVRPLSICIEALAGMPKTAVAAVKNISIKTHDGSATLALRIYYPDKHPDKPDSTHAMMYFHGGGCVIGSINSHDHLCRYLAQGSNIVIISVGYRLAPEHKFPTAIHDAIDAWNWLQGNKHSLNLQSHTIGAGGDSAGAYLAALLSLTQTHKGLAVQASKAPAFQYLLYPMVDLRGQADSYLNANTGMFLTRKIMDYFRKHYLISLDQTEQPIVSPLLARDLHLMPKTYLLSVEYDPLKDSGIAFANALKQQGVVVEHQHFNDCMHAFPSSYTFSQRARQAVDEITVQLKQLCST